jgi:hypothetical protein
MNAIMDLFSSPNLAVFEVFQDVNLTGSFRSILKPAIPKLVVREPVLSGANFEDFIPGFGPGEFVLEFGHRNSNLFTEAIGG